MYYHNQLKFNAEVPTKPINMAVKFQQPQPLVIEKFSHVVPVGATSFANHSQSALQLSTVSEEQLSMAVHLAKRDLQKQKESEMIERHLAKMNKGRAKVAEKPHQTRPHFKSSKKPETKQKGKRAAQVENKKVPKVGSGHSKGILHVNKVQSTPTNSMLHESLDGVITMSHEEFTLREIRRLKTEMDNCLTQMKKIEEIAKNGKWVARTIPGTEDLPVEEIQKRRAAWAEKQDHQSSRVVYTLQQQVKAIQKDLSQLKTPFTPKVRKEFLQRVAATYRKAVRGLQTLVNQLIDYDLSKGLPQPCHDFQHLMRQLAMCTAQLDIASSDQVPESVKAVFDDILRQIEITKSLQEESAASQERINFKKPGPGIIKKETVPQPARAQHVQEAHGARSPARDLYRRADASASPERKQALRQGIEALIRVADAEDGVPYPDVRRPSRSPHGKAVAWEVPVHAREGEPRKNKGLLLPHNLQAKRLNTARNRQSRPRYKVNYARSREYIQGGSGSPSHYSEPTVSSKLRAVPPHSPRQEKKSKPAWYSPGRSSPRTASSERGMSPRQCMAAGHDDAELETADHVEPSGAHHHRNKGLHDKAASSVSSYPRKNPRLEKPWETAHREIQRQVHFDRGTTKDTRNGSDARRGELDRLRSLRSEVHQQSRWAMDAARRIKDDLEPLLEDSQVNKNPNQLADLILKDALDETITDLQNKHDNNEDLDDNTARSLDTPTLETMLEKLREMEIEESEIRQRWATIFYEDVNGRRAKFYDASDSNHPRTPPSLEITNSPSKPRSSGRDKDLQNPSDVQPIVFSRPVLQKPRFERLQLSSRGIEVSASKRKDSPPPRDTRVPLFLSRDLVARIHDNRHRYLEHLQKNSNTSIGKFNPWHLVEVMADEILEDCVSDVVNEIEQIHSDIASNIYESEFKTVVHPDSQGTKKDNSDLQDSDKRL